MEKQVNLYGKVIGEESLSNVEKDEGTDILMSALQKCVRQGLTENAMYHALKLADRSWWVCWRRLSVIADEDVGQGWAIVAVDVLFRKFLAMKRHRKEKELSWDMKRCVVLASKILAEAPKDRRSDEFLELLDWIEKRPEDKQLKEIEHELAYIPDEAYDMHTIQGRKMGRGLLYWYEKSSETVNRTPKYERWHSWFKPLMVRLAKKEVKQK